MNTPKFSVGDVVSIENNSDFNPGDGVITIGTIRAIHINNQGVIKYDIEGCSLLRHDENNIKLVKEGLCH